MRKFGLLGTSALGSFTFIGLSLALAAPAHAQGTDAPDACTSLPEGAERDNCLAGETELESGTNANPTDASDATITITGSRIAVRTSNRPFRSRRWPARSSSSRARTISATP
jgi:hypothetical protein